MATEQIPLIVFHIETTGPRYFGTESMIHRFGEADACFSIAAVCGTSDTDKESWYGCADLNKVPGSRWVDHWDQVRFNPDHFHDIWSKNNCSKLRQLQDKKASHFFFQGEDMMDSLNNFIKHAEEKYGSDKLKVVADSSLYDPAWISIMLQYYEYPGLSYSREKWLWSDPPRPLFDLATARHLLPAWIDKPSDIDPEIDKKLPNHVAEVLYTSARYLLEDIARNSSSINPDNP